MGDKQPTWGQRVKGDEDGAGNGVIRGVGALRARTGSNVPAEQKGASSEIRVRGQEGRGRQRVPALGSRLRGSPGREAGPRRGWEGEEGGAFPAGREEEKAQGALLVVERRAGGGVQAGVRTQRRVGRVGGPRVRGRGAAARQEQQDTKGHPGAGGRGRPGRLGGRGRGAALPGSRSSRGPSA